MIRKGTGGQVFPLQSGGNDNPAVNAGNVINWDLSALPISVGGGGQMAYYLLGLIMTFYGAVVQSGGTGSVIQSDALTAALVQSIQLQGAWSGTPIQQQYALGVFLPIIEYLGCGMRIPRREDVAIPAANGTYNFKRTIFVPLAIGNVARPYQTAQLALMYKKANFVVNMAAATVITTLSTGASITGTGGTGSLSMRVSAAIEPQPSLILAPGVDWVDYQSPASANQSQVLLNSFGNVTGLTGSNPNGGVVDLKAMAGTGDAFVGSWPTLAVGSFSPSTVQRYEFPWRAQYSTQHPEAVEAWEILSLGGNGKQGEFGTSAAITASDSQGYPHCNSNASLAGAPLLNMYGFPLVTSTEDLNLSDVQTASQNEYYTLALTAGNSFSGTNHTLARHVRSWTMGKMQDWANQVIAAGLANSVLGTSSVTSRYKPSSSQLSLTAKEAQFLPIYLFPKTAVSGGTPVIDGV
jgi:hypothetical protein